MIVSSPLVCLVPVGIFDHDMFFNIIRESALLLSIFSFCLHNDALL